MADGHGSENDEDIIAWNGRLIWCICLGLRITILPLPLPFKPCGVTNSDFLDLRVPPAQWWSDLKALTQNGLTAKAIKHHVTGSLLILQLPHHT